ncbi:MAG: hypothetical protein QOG85_186 [Gaiellaceae bacterium]|nr:hypothetical protein [Gaiellaceae bacterium]
MAPIVFVAVQLIVLAVTFILQIRKSPSPTFKAIWLAAYAGVIGMDIWYFANFAYPTGFEF